MPPVVVKIQRVPVVPPAELLVCADAKEPPEGKSQDALAPWLLAEADAGDDCRTKLKAVKSFVERETR